MSSSNPAPFRVALTADFYDESGATKYRDIGLGTFATHRHISYRRFEEHRPEIGADQVGDANGVVVLTPKVNAKSVRGLPELLAIGRFGVGYDSVDVEACTDADVAVFITTGAVDRSVAEATVAWMLALTHHVRAKDALVRRGDWEGRSQLMGSELRRKTLGMIGFGGIARSLVSLLAGFGMKQPLAYDPHVSPRTAEQQGVQLVGLDHLLEASDFVSIHCPLTNDTRDLIATRELDLMKPTAYLINTARGGIVHEPSLYAALRDGKIAGAAIDTFAEEPVTKPHPLGEFDNVLLAPHCIAWTDELFGEIGRMVCQGMVDLSVGSKPRGVVNPNVFQRPGFKRKWARWSK